MARAPLSQLNDWELEDKDQDLRGHYLMQEDGTRVGKIDEMIVDTDQEQIVALRLENGQEYPVSTVDLRDDEAYLLGTGYTRQTATTTTTEGAAARTPTRMTDATTGVGGTGATTAATAGAAGMRGTDARMTGSAESEERTIPITEERLRIRKQRAQTGEVELHTRVVEEQRTEQVPVMHEEVFVERRDVAERPADEAVLAEGETIRVPVMGEEAEVEKEAVVTGEVVVGKRQVVENEQVSGTVRRAEVDVDREGEARVRADADRDLPRDGPRT